MKKTYSQERITLKDHVPLEKPLSIFIEPTNVCTFQCVFCPIGLENYKTEVGGKFYLNLKMFKKIIMMIKDDFEKVKRLNFYVLGEPFANKNIFEFVKIAKDLDIAENLVIVTNGSLLSKDKYQKILDSGLDFLVISIYGHNEESFKELTRSKYSFVQIIKNVGDFISFRNANNKEKPVVVASIFFDNNTYRLIEILENIVDEIWTQHIIDWMEEEGKFTSKVQNANLGFPKQNFKTCGAAFYQMVIHSDLKVSICCNDWKKRLVIGDLRLERPREIWNGQKATWIRRAILKNGYKAIEACKHCITPQFLSQKDSLDDVSEDTFLKRLKEWYNINAD